MSLLFLNIIFVIELYICYFIILVETKCLCHFVHTVKQMKLANIMMIFRENTSRQKSLIRSYERNIVYVSFIPSMVSWYVTCCM